MKKYIPLCILIASLGIAYIVVSYLNTDADAINMNKGINLGNALESPSNEQWDMYLDNAFFDEIVDAGFDTVRIPVRFSDYTIDDEYTIDPTFLEMVDSFVDYALNLDLIVVIDLHHFDELYENVDLYDDEFYTIWEQLATHYQDYDKSLVFELLNEPNNDFNAYNWNQLLNNTIDIIRETNATRKIIIGSIDYYSIDTLYLLDLPEDDNIIVSFHYYEPYDFTFQGNVYHETYSELSDITWGSEEDYNALDERFKLVYEWSQEQGVDVYLGEFGVTKEVDEDSRVIWTKAVVDCAESYGFAWSYWEFGSGFGIYDITTNTWNANMLEALLGTSE